MAAQSGAQGYIRPREGCTVVLAAHTFPVAELARRCSVPVPIPMLVRKLRGVLSDVVWKETVDESTAKDSDVGANLVFELRFVQIG